MFKLAIIGPGSICRTYLEALKQSEAVEIAAVAGRDTEKGRSMASEYGVPYYVDQDEMYQREALDAVLICTPTDTHEEMVRRAISYHVHVMCEKPFVLDAGIASELMEEARCAGVRLMVMHVVRFWPEYRALKDMIQGGRLGEIKNVYMNRLSSHPTWASWHRDPMKSGGGLYDLHIHDIDYLYSVFGTVESVYAVGRQEKSGCWNNVSTVLKFQNGVSAVVEGFMDMTGDFAFTTGFRINGTEASVEMLNKTIHLEDGRTEHINQMVEYRKQDPAQFLEIERYNPYAREVETFVECVKSGCEEQMVPGADVVEVLKILKAIQTSLETGSIQRLL